MTIDHVSSHEPVKEDKDEEKFVLQEIVLPPCEHDACFLDFKQFLLISRPVNMRQFEKKIDF
jgi:hypothetical protein